MTRLFTAPAPIVLITLFFGGVHLCVAGFLPLIEDETYYALWAGAPSWGYYDHPPMVAWLIRAGEMMFGTTAFGVRLFHVACFMIITPLTWHLAKTLSLSGATATKAALAYNLSLLTLALSNFATPDAPSALFWIATLWGMAHAVRSDRVGWWVLAGAFAGLGIQSKFTNLFLCVGILVWLGASAQGRLSARSKGPWLAILTAFLVIAPLVMWNAANDWVGLERQFGRISAATFDALLPVQFLLITAVVFSPVMTFFAIKGAIKTPGLLGWTSLPVLAYLLWHSTQHDVAANWLIPLHPIFAIWATMGMAGLRKSLQRIILGISAVFAVVILGLAFKPGTPLFTSHSPPNQIRGWDQAVEDISTVMDTTNAQWIATSQYGLTGRLAWEYPDVPVWSLVEPERYLFRGDFPEGLCDLPGVIIERERSAPKADEFVALTTPEQHVERRGGTSLLYTYRVQAFRGCQ